MSIAKSIPADTDHPEFYIFTCLICRKREVSASKRLITAYRKEHHLATGHDVSFTREPLLTIKASRQP